VPFRSKFRSIGYSDHHRTALAQSFHNDGIAHRAKTVKQTRTLSDAMPCDPDRVLDTYRDASQCQPFTISDPPVDITRRLAYPIGIDINKRV
jgi:hypothetical protein